MRKIFTSTFYGFKGIEHKVYIWDRELVAGGTPVTMILESPGYTIDWNAGITDVVKGGIIESSASIYIRNKSNILDSFLNTLSTSNENRFLVEIYRGDSPSIPIWRGIILQDFGAVEDSPYGAIQLTATDGLSILDSVDVPDITLYENKTILQYIIEGLNEIPTEELITASGNFVRVKTDWFTAAMPAGKDPLDLCVVLNSEGGSLWNTKKTREGYNGSEVKETDFLSYKEMINQVLIHFNAVLLMSRGVWYILQRDELTAANIQFYGFKKDGTDDGLLTAEPTHKTVLPASEVYRAEGQFNYLPGLKKVKVTYLSNFENADGFSSLIPSSFTLMDTYTTAPLLTGTGNKLRIGIGFKETFQLSISMTSFKAYMQYSLDVRMGAYYLEAYGATYRWTLTPSVVLINSSIVITPTSGMEVEATTIFDEITEDIPVDDEVIITLTRSGWVSIYSIDPNMPLSYVLPSWATPAEIENYTPQTFLLFIFNNDAPVAYVEFEAENAVTEYSLEHVLEDNLFGSAGVGTSNGLFIIWDGSGWVYSLTPPTKMWGKGYASAKTQYFNELLVNEVLSNQAKTLVMFSGIIIDRTLTDLLLPSQAIELIYKGNTYRLYQNKVTYNPEEESWEGDWIEISRTPIVNAVIDSTEITTKPPQLPNSFTEWFNSVSEVVNSHHITAHKQGTDLIPFPVAGSVAIGIRPNGEMELRDGDNPESEIEVNVTTTIKKNGYLYNYPAVEGDSSKNIVNPNVDGGAWHIPTDTEFSELEVHLTDSLSGAGAKLKETGLTYWDNPNEGATDEVSFRARGNGLRKYKDSTFEAIKSVATWWTTTEDVPGSMFVWEVNKDTEGLYQNFYDINEGCGVRLVRPATAAELLYPDGAKVNDYIGNDGKYYKVVKIGTQVWIANNLCETLYDDGSPIPEVTDDALWIADTLGARCSYNNDEDNALLVTGGSGFSGDYNDLTNKPTLGTAAAANKIEFPQSGDAADTLADAYTIPFWNTVGSLWKKITWANIKVELNSIYATIATLLGYKKYTGFENRTESQISINSGTGVFTLDVLAPATSFKVYTNGTIWTLNAAQTVTITDDQTITYVYVDVDGVLKKSTTIWDITGNTAPCAIIFKDGTSYAITDERHSYNVDKQWHNWAHYNIGSMFRSGLTGTFTNTTLSIIQGIVADEDISYNTGGTKTLCSLWYRNATTGMRVIRNSSTPYRAAAGVLQYDDGSGTLAGVTSGRYSTQWVYATHDDTEPVYVVIGQNNSVNLTDARNTAYPTINLSTAEWKLIYRVIYRNLAGTATYIEAADFRTVQTGVPTTATTSDHAALINRDAASSHPDTAINLNNLAYAGNLAGCTTQEDANDVLDGFSGGSVNDINVVITPTYTGSLTGTTNQKEVNDIINTDLEQAIYLSIKHRL